MVVYGGLIDPSLRDDVTHARALETLVREQINGSLYDRAAGTFCRTGHLFLGSNGRLNSLNSTAWTGMQTFVNGPTRSDRRHHFASNGRLKLIRAYEIVVRGQWGQALESCHANAHVSVRPGGASVRALGGHRGCFAARPSLFAGSWPGGQDHAGDPRLQRKRFTGGGYTPAVLALRALERSASA